MQEIRRVCFSKEVLGGFLFILIGLIINYMYRDVFHSTPIEKIILGSDPEGYFQYLPHFFLRDWAQFNHLPWAIPYGDGKSISVFTCGIAILWTPFFLLAHAISLFFSLDSDGYGNVYYGFTLIAALFYVYLGCLFLYKLLRPEFGKSVTLRSFFLILLGTNLFYYTFILGAGMSHSYSFALISIYIYFVHRFFKESSIKYALLLALPFALAVLIRPTNLIAGLYFFLYGVNSIDTLSKRIQFWKINLKYIGIIISVGIIVSIPQMLYWYKVTGSPIIYSYQNYGFPYWNSPKLGTVLFGKYNGWITYTPVVLIGLYGLVVTTRKCLYNNYAVWLILLLAIYINASWWAPTFSAAVGQRAMIDFLPFLVLPMSWTLNKIAQQRKLVRATFWSIAILLVMLNIQFAFKYEAWFWWDSPWSWEKLLKVLSF